jgi:hypothetical protein
MLVLYTCRSGSQAYLGKASKEYYQQLQVYIDIEDVIEIEDVTGAARVFSNIESSNY